MKSEHRHKLRTNELAEWISNFPQWAKQNRVTIIYASIVVILVAGSYFWRSYRKKVVLPREQLEFTNLLVQLPQHKAQIIRDQARGFDSSYNLLPLANNLKVVAQNTKNDQMAALALIKQAEILRMELHYRLGTVSKQDVEAVINRAKASYTEATERLSAQGTEHGARFYPSLTAMAKLGLGLCEEEIGNFGQAEQIYRDITENASFESTVAAIQAKQRLAATTDYQKKIVFRKSPEPTQAKPGQPQIQLKVTDSNLPGQ